ncbi:MAG: hypothetical protein QM809_16170 [Gordonia sp. (in: high G+C Gram-positive bacteria)]|uniref:hypothetical protein n=1 Tax=Gordonia sp. (in: high G+C Gram-positive bacteria) TaxID=84139 RepID=UPI0039E272F2
MLFSVKIGVKLRTSADTGAVSTAIYNAMTIEPPFSQRKLKYRKAPGIGSIGDITRVDPNMVAEAHGLDVPPREASEIDFGNGTVVVRTWIEDDGTNRWASFICINDPQVGYPWASAIADRTQEFLLQAGVTDCQIEVVKSR